MTDTPSTRYHSAWGISLVPGLGGAKSSLPLFQPLWSAESAERPSLFPQRALKKALQRAQRRVAIVADLFPLFQCLPHLRLTNSTYNYTTLVGQCTVAGVSTVSTR